jgi:SP family general alpha glucoside:H+ symporter-like MFS transporter
VPHIASKYCPEYTSPPTSPSTYYYQLAGYSSSESFILQIIQQVISMIGNVISWFLVERAGQRPLMFYGLCSLTVDLILTDALAVVATPTALKGKSKFLRKYRLNIGSFHRSV